MALRNKRKLVLTFILAVAGIVLFCYIVTWVMALLGAHLSPAGRSLMSLGDWLAMPLTEMKIWQLAIMLCVAGLLTRRPRS